MFAKLISVAAIAGLASAQAVDVIPVLVGMNPNGTAGTFFSPETINAAPGTMIQFQFLGGNHTVTQSSFDEPCVPLAENGFHSDFRPAQNAAESGEVPLFTITVADDKPMWAYCAQGRHCQAGMVLSINPPAGNPDRTVETYRAAAAAVEEAGVPEAGAGGGANGGANGGGNNGGDGGAGGVGGGAGGDDNADDDENTPPVVGDSAGASLRVPAALLALVAGAVAMF